MAEEEKKNKVALITGITGQDGSYLAELLLSKEYEVNKKRKLSISCLCGSMGVWLHQELYILRYRA